MLRGNVTRLSTGLTTINIIERTAPPRTKVGSPPEISTPEIISESAKRAREYIRTFLIIDFIVVIII